MYLPYLASAGFTDVGHIGDITLHRHERTNTFSYFDTHLSFKVFVMNWANSLRTSYEYAP